MSSPYAWIIDTDHLVTGDPDIWEGHSSVGVVGPRDAHCEHYHDDYDVLKGELVKNYQHHHQFRMYDDDGELYYTGTLYWTGDPDDPEEEYLYGPLGDYGIPNAGCVEIRYTGRKEWDCG